MPGYDLTVKEHLDLQGASGATYRFRLVADLDQLPGSGGNFVYVRWSDQGPEVVLCGAVNSLSFATVVWSEAVRLHRAQGVYVRLNISRAVRDGVHADLNETLRPPMAPYSDT